MEYRLVRGACFVNLVVLRIYWEDVFRRVFISLGEEFF